MASKAVSDDSFDADVLQADGPVVVDFWAEWCGPCKQIGPSLEEISDEMGDALTVAKVNIDDNPMTPSKYGVRGIPTLMIFKGGELAATQVGALPKSKIVSALHGPEHEHPVAIGAFHPPVGGEAEEHLRVAQRAAAVAGDVAGLDLHDLRGLDGLWHGAPFANRAG